MYNNTSDCLPLMKDILYVNDNHEVGINVQKQIINRIFFTLLTSLISLNVKLTASCFSLFLLFGAF